MIEEEKNAIDVKDDINKVYPFRFGNFCIGIYLFGALFSFMQFLDKRYLFDGINSLTPLLYSILNFAIAYGLYKRKFFGLICLYLSLLWSIFLLPQGIIDSKYEDKSIIIILSASMFIIYLITFIYFYKRRIVQ